jgi:hypothetical protein
MICKNEKLGGRPFFENVTLRRTESITGVIEGPDGKPRGGYQGHVLLRDEQDRPRAIRVRLVRRQETDAQDRFVLPIVTPGDGVFWILPKKFTPSTHALKGGQAPRSRPV